MSDVVKHDQISRRQFLMRVLAFGGMLGTGSIGYSCFFEPQCLELSRVDITLKNTGTSDKISLLHLSDFHHSSVISLEFIEESIRLGLSNKPDLVCITGDFITGTGMDVIRYSRILGSLSQSAPTFACLGNHDGGIWAKRRNGLANITKITNLLVRSGITLLHNKSARIQIRENFISLIGVGDLWAEQTRPELAFSNLDEDQLLPKVLLVHNPDSKELLKNYDWDLMLCGHTHGGQVRVPFIGTPFAPILDHRYVAGLNSWRDRLIYTSKGVGNLYGIRINCRPEVSLLKLHI